MASDNRCLTCASLEIFLQQGVLGVVVTYNAESYIADNIEAALEAGVSELVVWDNASDDRTREILGQYANYLTIIENDKNLGFGAAVNRAIKMASRDGFERILLLNPDCRLSPEVLIAMNARLDESPEIAVVAPAMVYPGGERAISGGGFPSLAKEILAFSRLDDHLPRHLVRGCLRVLQPIPAFGRMLLTMQTVTNREAIDVDWVSGFCMLIKEDAWRTVGGFNEDFFLYFEDVALCRELRQAGWRVVNDLSVVAVHDESASAKHHRKDSHYFRAMLRYFRRYGTPIEKFGAKMFLAWRMWA